MPLGSKPKNRQRLMWIPHAKIALSPGHLFYQRLNQILAKGHFDDWFETLCEPYFREGGRLSLPLLPFGSGANCERIWNPEVQGGPEEVAFLAPYARLSRSRKAVICCMTFNEEEASTFALQ